MNHKYNVSGMTCNGCKTNVENAIRPIKGIRKVRADIKNAELVIESDNHISESKLQETLIKAGLHYTIGNSDEEIDHKKESHTHISVKSENESGVFYCPMHCEGDKSYEKSGSCPVCGMDLIEQASITTDTQFTCPMHPEIIKDAPGSCPKCGMDLIPMEADESEENKNYKRLANKMIIAVVFTLPIFLIAMADLIPGNPLDNLLSERSWNWVQFILSLPVVFYACWMFFDRAWKSIMTLNLNMFTLIGIGAGVAFLISVIALIFPGIFPEEFKTEGGNVFVYFEAVTVILTLVLLGQLLEAKAHSRTSGAIKELLKLAPTEATLVKPDGGDEMISIHAIKKGDLLEIKARR